MHTCMHAQKCTTGPSVFLVTITLIPYYNIISNNSIACMRAQKCTTGPSVFLVTITEMIDKV